MEEHLLYHFFFQTKFLVRIHQNKHEEDMQTEHQENPKAKQKLERELGTRNELFIL